MKKSILVFAPLMIATFLVSCNSHKDTDEVSFSFDGQYCTLANSEKSYQKGQKVELKLSADTGYNLPDDVVLDFGSNRGVIGKDYDYKIETEGDKKYAKLSFNASDDITLGAAVKEAHNPLTFTCETNDVDLCLVSYYSENTSILINRNLEYSLDGIDWKTINIVKPTEPGKYFKTDVCAHLKKGQKVYFRGNNPDGFNHVSGNMKEVDICHFATSNSLTNYFSVSGNVLSLLSNDYTAHSVLSKSGCLSTIFAGYDAFFPNEPGMNLISAHDLLLPSIDLSENCYMGMFMNNSVLIDTPYLPANKLKNYSYIGMFGHCYSLCVSNDPTGNKTKIFTCPPYVKDPFEPCPIANMFLWCDGELDPREKEGPLPDVTYYYYQSE